MSEPFKFWCASLIDREAGTDAQRGVAVEVIDCDRPDCGCAATHVLVIGTNGAVLASAPLHRISAAATAAALMQAVESRMRGDEGAATP